MDKDKLKDGKSLETQFWNDNINVDKNSPLTKIVDDLWGNAQNNIDYIPTIKQKEKFIKDMKEYHKDSTRK